MTVIKFILVLIFIAPSYGRVPDKVYCLDETCSKPLSRAKTLITYTSADPDHISYRNNAEALVFMKSAGTNPELWFASIEGKAGFVNSKFLREQKVFEKNPTFVVPTESLIPKISFQPDKVKQPHEVVEGTTLYTTEATVKDINTAPQPASSLPNEINENLGTIKPVDNINPKNVDFENIREVNERLLDTPNFPQQEIPNVQEAQENDIQKKNTIETNVRFENVPNQHLNVHKDVNVHNPETKDQNYYKQVNLNEAELQKTSETLTTVPIQKLNEENFHDHNILNEKSVQKGHEQHVNDLPIIENSSPNIHNKEVYNEPQISISQSSSRSGSEGNIPNTEGIIHQMLNDKVPESEQNVSVPSNMNKNEDHDKHAKQAVADSAVENTQQQNNLYNNIPNINGEQVQKNPELPLETNREQNNFLDQQNHPNEKLNKNHFEKSTPFMENPSNILYDNTQSEINRLTETISTKTEIESERTLPIVNRSPNSDNVVNYETGIPSTLSVTERNIEINNPNTGMPPIVENPNNIIPNINLKEIQLESREVPSVDRSHSPEYVLNNQNENIRTPPHPAETQRYFETNNAMTEIPPVVENVNNIVHNANLKEQQLESIPPYVDRAPNQENVFVDVAEQLRTPPPPYLNPITENYQQDHFENPTTETSPLLFNPSTSAIPDISINEEQPLTTDLNIQTTTEGSKEPVSGMDENTNINQELQSNQEVGDKHSYYTETPVDIEYGNTAESNLPTSDEYQVFPEETTKGWFASIFDTLAGMWTSSSDDQDISDNTEDSIYDEPKTDNAEEFSFIKYLIHSYYSVMGIDEETRVLFTSAGDACYTENYCDGQSNTNKNRLLTFLLTTASSVLLFTLGYYYIDIRRQDGRLIGTINSLQRDLLFTTKECEILKEELSTTKTKLAGIEDNSFGMDDMVQSLKEEINEMKAQNDRLRHSLDDNEKLLRVSENTAEELQNTLSEVENTLSELLAERANLEEQIAEINGKAQAFEEELITVSRDRDNFQLKYVSAETTLKESEKQVKEIEQLNKQLSETKNKNELLQHEIDALKDALRQMKHDPSSNVDVASLIDHAEIKAQLSKALVERNNLANKYEVEQKERVRLDQELKKTQESLHATNQQATEAVTRLEVLGKYFQDRESELLKELSTKESLWLSKQGESASTVEKIELLQQELQRFKEKCDTLSRELAEQESLRRAAVGEVEARAHTAWLEARAARRDADAARDLAAALRRKLAATAHDGALSPHHKVASPLEMSENPVLLPPPLPPLSFLPPPLLPPLPRPPPLGRLPSPLQPRYGDRRYSPDSRYSPQRRYSPESRYSPETVRYSPDSRYSPPPRRSPYSPRPSRRRSRDRYEGSCGSRSRNAPETESEYPSDSPSRSTRRRSRYQRHSGPSSGSGCSSESDK